MFKFKLKRKPEIEVAYTWRLNVDRSPRIGDTSGLVPGDIILNEDDGKMYHIYTILKSGYMSYEEVTGFELTTHTNTVLKPGTPYKKIDTTIKKT